MKKIHSKKQCSKVGYHNKKVARDALNRFGKDRGSIRVYKCPHHNEEMWHLSSHKC